MQAQTATAEQLVARAQIYDVLMQYMRGVDRRDMDLAVELPYQWLHQHFGRGFNTSEIAPA